MVGVEEGREFRFRGDLYSQESIAEIFWRVNSADYARCDVLCRSGVTRVLGARRSTGVALKCALPERGRTGRREWESELQHVNSLQTLL